MNMPWTHAAPDASATANTSTSPLARVDVLLLLNLAQLRDLVAVLRCAFELQRFGGLLHRRLELFENRVVAPVEKHHRMTHVVRIALRRNQLARTARCSDRSDAADTAASGS